jgi:hypothetical protein
MRFAQEGHYCCVRSSATGFAPIHKALVFLDIGGFFASLVTNMAKQTLDHLTEIAEILAAGFTRLKARKSSRKPAELGESSLHFSPDQSGGVAPYSAEASHD